MEEEDDDFYEPAPVPSSTDPASSGAGPSKQDTADEKAGKAPEVKTEPELTQDLEEGEEEEAEEDTDDSDIDIITERKDGTKPEPPPKSGRHHTLRNIPSRPTPPVTPHETTPAVKAEPAAKTATSTRSGADYPAVPTSKLDVDRMPVYSPVGKPLDEIDIDEDLKEHDKAWRIPGTDVSDYFNYGFDEFTWTLYCLKQEKTRAQAQEDKAQFTSGLMMGAEGAALGEAGTSSLPSNAAPSGLTLPPMPGMPDLPPEMQAMMAQMLASGLDPAQLAQMDPTAFSMPQPATAQGASGGQAAGTPAPPFGNAAPPFGPQSQNAAQMPYAFDPGMMGVDGGRNRPGNFGGRGRGGRRHW